MVFDTTCLSHFARADRLDVLGDLLTDVKTLVPLDNLDRLRRFTVWTARVRAGARNLGEASVLAVAEEFEAVALIDEREATEVGRRNGVEVHGTLWLLAGALRNGDIAEAGAENLVDALAATGMRLPCKGAGFVRFATRHGLL
ncbi:hypothetical protein ACQP2X_33015 [Actinoplanes sp. CA-131856]